MIGKWRLFGFAGVVATAAYVLGSSPVMDAVCVLFVGVGAVVSCFVAPRRFGAEPRAAWTLMGVSASLFLIGVLVRPEVTEAGVPLIADCFTIPGYLSLCVLLGLLQHKRRSLERHAVLDGIIVWLAGGLVSLLVLALPAAAVPGRSALMSALAGMYPMFDIVVLMMVVSLTFTTRAWPVSLLALMGSMAMLLTGDLAYAIIGTTGRLYSSPLLDAPFLIAYTLMGIMVLHPSVVELSRPARPPAPAWSVRRVAVIVPALAAPFVLLITVGDTRGRRLAIAVVGALIVGLLLLRAIGAVRAQAAASRLAEHRATHDALTGLPNRNAIAAEIAGMLARIPPDSAMSVLVLDLDGFKNVNDTWGHDTGDQVVLEVAARLRAAAPPTVPVAALGGDEFLLAHVGDAAAAERLVSSVRACFDHPFAVHDLELKVGVSIGVARAGRDGDAEELMRDADTAMYQAKEAGPEQTCWFDRSMHDRVRERVELEMALRRALRENQLWVAYQPLIRIADGLPIGAEALVRWNHPDRGPISPAVFIPIAEDAGLIGAIGTWVRQEALRQLSEWRTAGVVGDDFYMSINVSGKQLVEHEFPLVVTGELARFGVPARCVALEMTETVMMDGSSAAGRVLFQLRELGFRLLIDDFGTGFSGLGYLRRFPVTGVKIDRSFVIGLGADEEAGEIVRAIVAMSQALKLSVIAEGVETRAQRDTLASIGVVTGQGWLWGPAVAPADFAAHWHASGAAAAISGSAENRTPGSGITVRSRASSGATETHG